ARRQRDDGCVKGFRCWVRSGGRPPPHTHPELEKKKKNQQSLSFLFLTVSYKKKTPHQNHAPNTLLRFFF
ncbi:hypothetical protein, partial [Enterobacter hormaechei]